MNAEETNKGNRCASSFEARPEPRLWSSFRHQLKYPEFFGGAWIFNPDPIDFTRYQTVNIYEDENAFTAPGRSWVPAERPMRRSVEGQVNLTVRQISEFEAVLGSKGRSGYQFNAWETVYGPAGDDGCPRALWDQHTGKIDHEVAMYMRDHGFDLRYYAEKNWGGAWAEACRQAALHRRRHGQFLSESRGLSL